LENWKQKIYFAQKWWYFETLL